MTEYYEAHLYGRSQVYAEPQTIKDSFNLFIFTVGWEERCTKIIDFDSNLFCFEKSIILSFEHQDKKGWKKKYYEKVRKFCKTIKKGNPSFHVLKSLVPERDRKPDVDDLLLLIKDEYLRVKQPLKVGFDISSCPRVVFLQVLRFCIESDFVKSISFFYSEGDYEPFIDKEDIFSSGDWEAIAIPGFTGKNFDLKRKDYVIISFGFEKRSYIGWIEEFDNLSRIGILFPYPGYKPEYEISSKNKLKEFKKELSLDQSTKSQFSYETAIAGDAIEAWKNLESLLTNKQEYNITFLPYGPKPHSLAMGLRCLLNDNLILTYRISSKGYKNFDVKPLGKIWQYEIRNLALY
jgi:hypothetical protein